MKKKTLAIILSVLLILCGAWLYLESRVDLVETVDSGLSEAAILQEMPELAMTERDIAMGAALLDAPELRAALAEAADVVLPEATAARLLAEWTPEGCEDVTLVVMDYGSVIVGFTEDTRTIQYEFFEDESAGPRKVIAISGRTFFRENGRKAVYQNDGGAVTKLKVRHVWFAWLTEER